MYYEFSYEYGLRLTLSDWNGDTVIYLITPPICIQTAKNNFGEEKNFFNGLKQNKKVWIQSGFLFPSITIYKSISLRQVTFVFCNVM